jgi:hypothetical protein
LESSGSGNVYVLDTASGNLSVKKLSDTAKGWLVKDTDFNQIGQVKVRVEHEGRAVQEADVVLNDGTAPRNVLIDSASNGIAEFYGVKAGNVGIEVSYHSGDKSKTQKQSFAVDLKRDTAVPVLVVSLTEDVATAAATPAPSGTSGTSSAQTPAAASKPVSLSPQQKKVGDFAGYIFAILFVAAMVYGGYMWLQKGPNVTKAQDALQKVGLSLHDPSPFDPNTAVPVNTPAAPPPPQQQILLAGGAPTPLQATPIQPIISSAVHVTADPHFTRDTGEVVPLSEGASTLGRDASVELSFPAETSISRRHAEVVRSGDNIVVRDLGSTNGTFVNGVKIDGDAALRPGDSVQFGMMKFRFEG